jgi:hypothetical protein
MIVDDLCYSVWIYAVPSHMFMHSWSSPMSMAIVDGKLVMIIVDGGSIGNIPPKSKPVPHACRVVSKKLHA